MTSIAGVDDGQPATTDRGHAEAAAALFAGPGEVRALARTLDWGATPLGWPDTWSPALRVATRAMLDSPFPLCLWSGPEYALVYNDGYRRILGAKHPAALGRPGSAVWAELWAALEPEFARVRAGGPPVYHENARFIMARLEGGRTEDAWFSYSLSALRDEDGSVAAVLNISPETTGPVLAERALVVERARLEEVFRRAPSFIVAFRGPDQVYEFVNEAYYQLVGHREILGRPLLEAVPEIRGQGFKELLDGVRDTGEPWVGREAPVALQRTPGAPIETRYLDMVFQALAEADGTRSGVVVHGSDVTEHVLARRELELANQQLQEQAMELEARAEELQERGAELEERTQAAEAALAALANSEARARELAEALPVHVWTAAPDGRLTFVSEHTSTYFGVTAERLLGDGWGDFVHPDDAPEAFSRWARALATGTPYETEFRLRSGATGAWRWFIGRAVPRRDAAGGRVEWIGSNTDIDDAKVAAGSAAAAAARFRGLSSASPVGIFDADLAGNVTYANPRLQAIWEMSEAEMLGRGWGARVHPDDAPSLVRDWTAALAAGQPFAREYRLLLPDGGVRVVHGRSAIVSDANGRPVATVGTIDDITAEKVAEEALRASETRLRDIFEQAPVAVAVLDGPEHVYAVASPRYRAMIGARPLVGRSVRDAFPELAGQPFFDLMDRVYATGVPYTAAEQRAMIAREEGGAVEERFFNVGYQPLRDPDGHIYGIATVAADVTPQVHARREADAARAEAEAANRAKSEFLANMSHELRTPLNAIGGYAELLSMGLRGPVTDAQQDDFGRIRRASQHLLGLITDILNFARLEAGQVEFRVRDVPLGPLMTDLESLVGPQLVAKGLAFSHDGCASDTPEQPHTVRADAEKLRQILLNLITNAIKFTDRGGQIALSCEDDADAGVVRVRAADTGRGIPAEQIERIFEPFVQVDRHRTHESQQGVGLGLAISRDLARGMGGELTVESAVGRGSTFTLTLPRSAGEGGEARPAGDA